MQGIVKRLGDWTRLPMNFYERNYANFTARQLMITIQMQWNGRSQEKEVPLDLIHEWYNKEFYPAGTAWRRAPFSEPRSSPKATLPLIGFQLDHTIPWLTPSRADPKKKNGKMKGTHVGISIFRPTLR